MAETEAVPDPVEADANTAPPRRQRRYRRRLRSRIILAFVLLGFGLTTLFAFSTLALRNRLEAELVQIWQQVLGVANVGIRDDFFDLGGQSFAAIQVMTRIEQRCGKRLPLGDLLRSRTIERLARHMEDRSR